MIRLDIPVIVEGKYDKIALSNVIDGLIITTDGFGIFKNKEKEKLIRFAAKKTGKVIILTDPDSGGTVIRSHLKQILGDTEIIGVYIPRIAGKEKRKSSPGAEGILGVEGMSPEIIEEAFKKSGVSEKSQERKKEISKTDLFEFGLSGGKDSLRNRKRLTDYLGLPTLTANALLDILNTYFTLNEFKGVAEKCLNRETKS